MDRLLIVDDEQGLLDALSEEFAAQGFEVETATSGLEAIEKAEAEAPDLVLLDIRMPGMDGLETLGRLMEIQPGLGVIVVSAVHDADMAQRAMELGAFDYLTKPFDLDYLRASVVVKAIQMKG